MNVVTDDMVQAALDAYSENEWRTSASAMRAALAAVAPLIRRVALEDAAKYHDEAADEKKMRAVAALVEALEGLMHWHPAKDTISRMGLKPEPAEAAYEAARVALALYRGAGR